jgi:tetratricopeptide (TPR) repeat protein
MVKIFLSLPRSALVVALLGILLMPATASAQLGGLIRQRIIDLGRDYADQQIGNQPVQPVQTDSWIDARVMTIRPGVYTRHSDDFGRQIRDSDLTDLVYKVLNEQGDFLWVRHRGVESWVPRQDVVLIEDAVSYFSERVRANPNDAYAYAARGRAWREEGELERALKDLNEAIRLEPKNAYWYANRGLVYDDLDETDRALDDYDDAIHFNPKDAELYNSRGVAYKHDGQYNNAIDDYTDALKLDPKLSDAYFNRGNAYKAKKDYDLAIRDYTDAIRLDPESPDLYFNRANARIANRDYRLAVADLKSVVRLDPKDADAYSSLAWLLATCPDAKVRDGKKAVLYATKACELTKWKAPYFLATLAAAQAEVGEFELALKWQEKALDSSRYERDEGDSARERLKLYKDHKPYREN